MLAIVASFRNKDAYEAGKVGVIWAIKFVLLRHHIGFGRTEDDFGRPEEKSKFNLVVQLSAPIPEEKDPKAMLAEIRGRPNFPTGVELSFGD